MFPLGHPSLVKSFYHAHTPTVRLARSISFEANERLRSTYKPQPSVEETPMSMKKNKVMIKAKSGTRRKRETPQTLTQPEAHVLTTISNNSNLCQRFPIACPRELISQTAKTIAHVFPSPLDFSLLEGPCWNEITVVGVGGFCLQGARVCERRRYEEKDGDAEGRRAQSLPCTAYNRLDTALCKWAEMTTRRESSIITLLQSSSPTRHKWLRHNVKMSSFASSPWNQSRNTPKHLHK